VTATSHMARHVFSQYNLTYTEGKEVPFPWKR